jgi:hypothetical protein
MKRIALLALVLCALLLPRTATSQDLLENYNAGHWVIGTVTNVQFANYSGDLYEQNSNSYSAFNIGASGGVMATRGLAIGALTQFKSESQGSASASSLQIGPYIQYFFVGTGPLVPSLAAGFLYTSYSNGLAFTQTDILLRGALNYMITSNVSIGGGLQYNIQSRSYDDIDKSISGGVLQINVGFGIHL